jgi:hypothetical protein
MAYLQDPVWARLGKPEKVAQAVMMLLGNDCMTGQTVAMSRSVLGVAFT